MRLIVIGGGAAGFFCAVTAARINPEMEVILVEKSDKLLSKVRISGGGRCNVTHACFSIPEMIKKYPRGENFVKKAFRQFFTDDTIDWFKQRSILLKTEADGRIFPVSDSSQTIIDCLLKEADMFRVVIRLHKDVKALYAEADQWKLIYSDGSSETAERVCVACGGYPKESMFEWLKNIGHTVSAPVPSLFTFNMPGEAITALMGISTKAKIRIQGSRLEESGPVLITHWGLSGPAVLKLSARGARELAAVDYRFTLLVNWAPMYNEQFVRDKLIESRLEFAGRKVSTRNPFEIPQRLWDHLCSISGIDEPVRWGDLPAVHQNRLVKHISAYELKAAGKTTFKEEFVTAGGVALSEIDPHTMESRLVKGLFFSGEIMDVDGVTGGFNFQHAWTSGWIAGNNAAKLPIFAPPK